MQRKTHVGGIPKNITMSYMTFFNLQKIWLHPKKYYCSPKISKTSIFWDFFCNVALALKANIFATYLSILNMCCKKIILMQKMSPLSIWPHVDAHMPYGVHHHVSSTFGATSMWVLLVWTPISL